MRPKSQQFSSAETRPNCLQGDSASRMKTVHSFRGGVLNWIARTPRVRPENCVLRGPKRTFFEAKPIRVKDRSFDDGGQRNVFPFFPDQNNLQAHPFTV